MQQTRQHIASQWIGAQQELRAAAFLPERRHQRVLAELFGRAVGRQNIGTSAMTTKRQKDIKPNDRAAVFAEVKPELAQTTRADFAFVLCCVGHYCFLTFGIDQTVEHIDRQIDQHHDQRDQQQTALHHRIIASEDAIDHPFANCRAS